MRALAMMLCVLSVVGCAWPAADAPAPAPPVLWATVAIGDATVSGLLRATDDERRVGLMYRKDRLKDDEGMLFVMDDVRIQSFWMKNTLIPLDMIFIDERGVIAGVLANVPPESTASRKIDKPSRFVLEVDAGWTQRHGVSSGDQTQITLSERAP